MLHQGAVMAIKRPTKAKGTPSHKPVATAPLRHVDVRAPQQMGEPGCISEATQCRVGPGERQAMDGLTG
jgi:hypothetical protein